MKKSKPQHNSKSVLRVSMLLFWIALFLGGTVILLVIAANNLDEDSLRTEILLPLIVIAGVVALLATLAIAAATFGLFDIADKTQALGLPPGSVQAVIALSLILIFAVVSLYAAGTSGDEYPVSNGLTKAEVEAIPAEQIFSSKPEKKEPKSGGEETYEVVRKIENQDKKDMNTQLLTTVSTLVVAVAGFYFGSKSVQEGSKAVNEAATPRRSLTIVEPNSPYEWSGPAGPLNIRVKSEPASSQVRWSVQNDDGAVQDLGDGTFDYVPGSIWGKGGTAAIQFEQMDDPTASDWLIVNFQVPPAPVEAGEPEPAGPQASPPPSPA